LCSCVAPVVWWVLATRLAIALAGWLTPGRTRGRAASGAGCVLHSVRHEPVGSCQPTASRKQAYAIHTCTNAHTFMHTVHKDPPRCMQAALLRPGAHLLEPQTTTTTHVTARRSQRSPRRATAPRSEAPSSSAAGDAANKHTHATLAHLTALLNTHNHLPRCKRLWRTQTCHTHTHTHALRLCCAERRSPPQRTLAGRRGCMLAVSTSILVHPAPASSSDRGW
jgi:hypothetical protein